VAWQRGILAHVCPSGTPRVQLIQDGCAQTASAEPSCAVHARTQAEEPTPIITGSWGLGWPDKPVATAVQCPVPVQGNTHAALVGCLLAQFDPGCASASASASASDSDRRSASRSSPPHLMRLFVCAAFRQMIFKLDLPSW
jgi:hypothetical protein